VKDEELQHLAKDIRSRDATIKEIADKLTETAEAAEAAASAAHSMDKQRRLLCLEIQRLKQAIERQMEQSLFKVYFYLILICCHSEFMMGTWSYGHAAETI
jgi:peptide deformylase